MQIITMHALGGDCTIHIKFFTYYAGIMLNAYISTYYAQNYASIIGSGLVLGCSNKVRSTVMARFSIHTALSKQSQTVHKRVAWFV